jgi:hypothetical protein
MNAKRLAGVAAGLFFLSGLATPGVPGEPQPPRWHTDLADARAEAQKTNRPIFAVFR